jgi:peptidoglycan hydrolase-like protein with peptidoglycan-binding domain
MANPVAAGSDSSMIKALQGALAANGYSAPINGTLDAATTAALQAFQGDNALPVQASCDAACWSALYAARKTT